VKLDLEQLKKIIALVRDHELSEFEIEHEGLRLRIRKDAVPGTAGAQHHVTHAPPAAAGGVNVSSISPAGAGPQAGAPAAPPTDSEIELAVLKSPIVGTFYRSPEPTAPAFVEIGSTVKKGQVLCIVEAMKLMNEIDSEYDGEIVSIYVENGQPVQYGERLFAIRTR
jgi:acetyl-CoA carboxylase biotin carboxyl carrier protein